MQCELAPPQARWRAATPTGHPGISTADDGRVLTLIGFRSVGAVPAAAGWRGQFKGPWILACLASAPTSWCFRPLVVAFYEAQLTVHSNLTKCGADHIANLPNAGTADAADERYYSVASVRRAKSCLVKTSFGWRMSAKPPPLPNLMPLLADLKRRAHRTHHGRSQELSLDHKAR